MDQKPKFEHPQSQSSQPAYGQIDGGNIDLGDLVEITDKLDFRIKSHIHNGGEATRINFNTDIIGLIETVTSAPTVVPSSPFDQIKIAVISGTTYLYVYDSLNHAWLRTVIA